MTDPRLNKALKWAIENSADGSANGTTNGSTNGSTTAPRRGLDEATLAAIMGGPSDADLMKESMAAIYSPEQSHANKMIAWDNFEQMIESLDNANNMQNLGLWPALIAKFDEPDGEVGSSGSITDGAGASASATAPSNDANDSAPAQPSSSTPGAQIRQMAFWCTTTAVQNNAQTQHLFFQTPGALKTVIRHALSDPDAIVRRKAVNALSSTVRNYQVAMDFAIECLPEDLRPSGSPSGAGSGSGSSLDAGDMDAVDRFVEGLRETVARGPREWRE